VTDLLNAHEISRPAYSRLRAMFNGYTGSVVYFVRRSDPEYVKIGVSTDLGTRTSSFLNASLEPITYELVIPGRRPLEAFFHRRFAEYRYFGEWHSNAEEILAEAREFLARLTAAHYETWDIDEAMRRTLRIDSQRYADIERLWANGITLGDIADLAGCTIEELRGEMDRMRALGFVLAHRRVFASRRAAA
jgi:hypothetical protein